MTDNDARLIDLFTKIAVGQDAHVFTGGNISCASDLHEDRFALEILL